MQYYYTSTRMMSPTVGMNVEKLEPLVHCWWDCKMGWLLNVFLSFFYYYGKKNSNAWLNIQKKIYDMAGIFQTPRNHSISVPQIIFLSLQLYSVQDLYPDLFLVWYFEQKFLVLLQSSLSVFFYCLLLYYLKKPPNI